MMHNVFSAEYTTLATSDYVIQLVEPSKGPNCKQEFELRGMVRGDLVLWHYLLSGGLFGDGGFTLGGGALGGGDALGGLLLLGGHLGRLLLGERGLCLGGSGGRFTGSDRG